MIFYSKHHIQHGKAEIKGQEFNFSFHDDIFDFVSTEDLLKDPTWKPLKRQDFTGLSIKCIPFGEEKVVAEIIGTCDPYISFNRNLKCGYEKLFIHKEPFSIDALELVGPSIDQIVQNTTVRRELANGKNPHDLSLFVTFSLFGKKCELTTATRMCNEDERKDIGYKSSIYLHFFTSLTTDEAFSIYKAFIRLIQFMSHRRDIFFECNSYEIIEKAVYPNGSLYLPLVTEKDIDKETRTISIESILPSIGNLLQFVIEEKIVPLFIPAKKIITFSDSYILATAWAQMVFKQVYVPANPNYSIKNYSVYDNSSGKKVKIDFKDQLSIMITDSFSYISDFAQISFPVLLSGLKISDYTSKDLPERLKNVRNAIAHGSDNPKDYEYTRLDMVVLLCSIYYTILKKNFGLDDQHLRLALSELFFDSTEVFSQWKELHKSD